MKFGGVKRGRRSVAPSFMGAKMGADRGGRSGLRRTVKEIEQEGTRSSRSAVAEAAPEMDWATVSVAVGVR